MKIAIIADTHIGYARFEQDSYNQAEQALKNAEQKADLILLLGDVFDIKVPKMETIQKAISIFKKIKKPIIAIHGNHERRSKDMTNPLQLLNEVGVLTYLHNDSKQIENVNIIGVGSIPTGYVKEALEQVVGKNKPKENCFNILMIHQDISELSFADDLSLQDVEELPYDLILNGHIHKNHVKLNGKLIIPGSTVVTQLKEEETNPRGYILYNTENKEKEFIEIPHRKFELIKLNFENAGINEIKEKINETISKIPEEQITRIIIKGTIKQGLNINDIHFQRRENLFIDNKLDNKSLKEKLENIKQMQDEKLSVKEFALKELEKRLKGKVSFNSIELFEELSKGVEDAEKYLEEKNEDSISS